MCRDGWLDGRRDPVHLVIELFELALGAKRDARQEVDTAALEVAVVLELDDDNSTRANRISRANEVAKLRDDEVG